MFKTYCLSTSESSQIAILKFILHNPHLASFINSHFYLEILSHFTQIKNIKRKWYISRTYIYHFHRNALKSYFCNLCSFMSGIIKFPFNSHCFFLHQILFNKLIHHKLYCLFHELYILLLRNRDKFVHRFIYFG